MKKRKGVTVRRKLGKRKLKKIETKNPEPVVTDIVPLSGVKPSELPVPVFDTSGRINSLLAMIKNNTRVIEQFRKGLAAIQAILNKPKESWTHTIKRKGKLISSVESSSGSRLVVHKVHRDKNGVINSISTRHD